MIILTRDQLIARLLGRYPLSRHDDGSVWVELRDAGLEDERVPADYFAELRDGGLVEELSPGEWWISAKGRRRFE